MLNVKDYGATGIAQVQRKLTLTRFRAKWISYPEGTTATVRYPSVEQPYDSVAIQHAIDQAHEAGGGTVLVPAGDYLIAPLRLRSRVHLNLEPGAKLWGSPILDDYAEQQNLILAEGEDDLAIIGSGEIHGQSPAWIIPWMNEGNDTWGSLRGRRPGKMIVFRNCRRVAIEGIRIFDSPSWTLVFQDCKYVRVHGLLVRHFDVINADGIDLVDTSHATISDCDLHVTDDGICMKNDQTKAEPAGVHNIAVTNCVIRTCCNGVKIGTESTGMFENISVSNMVIHNSADDPRGAEGGIHVCCCDGGHVRNVSFRGFVMHNVLCPFYVVTTPRSQNQRAFRTPRTGQIERLSISGIRADGSHYTPFVVGCPDAPIRGIRLTDIAVHKTAAFEAATADQPVPECAEQYPTPFMFGEVDHSPRGITRDGLPAHALYLRDAQNVTVKNMQTTLDQPDARPLFVKERCHSVNF